ncbi:MAG TPA: SAM-dependent chlorinase/fluorinase [Erysipelotrichaceae bacterium]|nr:SAM-dependent chlorinase/fluorinase [Erysipelotrichaceae bacterium]
MNYPTIVMMTDFGADNISACAMKGVCKTVCNDLVTADLTHSVIPFNTWEASAYLIYVEPFWPKGTIFVSVVDPGVGTKRKACVAKLKDGNYVVTPDNGTLTHVFYEIGIQEVREIDESINRLPATKDTSVFHGRDLFAYCAARLAANIISYEEVGPLYPVESIVLHNTFYNPVIRENHIEGLITAVFKHFGNLFTNIHYEDFNKAGFKEGDYVDVRITHKDEIKFNQKVLYQKSFGYVDINQPIIFNGSNLVICLALNQGSFAEVYQISSGMDWRVEFKK